MIIAATGHRPDKLGGYSYHNRTRLYLLAMEYLGANRPDEAISGMALGWDQAFADAAISLNIPLIAAIPFEGQEEIWPEEARRRHNTILRLAKRKVVVCSGGYAPWKLQQRNQWMVNNCDTIVALWDGSTGGTANCLRYATKRGKPITNLWDQFK